MQKLKHLTLTLLTGLVLFVGFYYLNITDSQGDVLNLKAFSTDTGTKFHGDNARYEIQVAHIDSLLTNATVVIHHKQRWLQYILCFSTCIMAAVLMYQLTKKRFQPVITESPAPTESTEPN